ncbi:ImmA/IrrE family metallo-endopeptidase [Nocardioides sp. W3-2-3]|nr:ImmA/IrrE family metallo-endopeptidase [Nocardioides convexus]
MTFRPPDCAVCSIRPTSPRPTSPPSPGSTSSTSQWPPLAAATGTAASGSSASTRATASPGSGTPCCTSLGHVIWHGHNHRIRPHQQGTPREEFIERAADYFAACVLMPRRELKSAWGSGLQKADCPRRPLRRQPRSHAHPTGPNRPQPGHRPRPGRPTDDPMRPPDPNATH